MDATSSTEPQISVPWNRLRACIDAQESAERQSGQTQLSRVQIASISHLISFADEEPDVSDIDHVSNLMFFTQSRRITAPVFTDLEPVIIPVEGSFMHREAIRREAGTRGPLKSIPQKKSTHRYRNAYISTHRPQPRVNSPNINANPNGHANKSNTPRKSPIATPPIPTASPNSVTDGDSDPSVFEQVATLSQRLGIDNPVYVIEPDEDTPNFFCGRPQFKNAARVPMELGVVSNVYGEKQAKIQVAELVLKWLQVEFKKRQDHFTDWFPHGRVDDSERGIQKH